MKQQNFPPSFYDFSLLVANFLTSHTRCLRDNIFVFSFRDYNLRFKSDVLLNDNIVLSDKLQEFVNAFRADSFYSDYCNFTTLFSLESLEFCVKILKSRHE